MTQAANSTPWPTELRVADHGHMFHVSFEDGRSYALTAEYLRVESPSAEVQGHAPEQKITVPGKRAVKVVKVDPVGNYAVRLLFDDGHNTGLYTWELLHRMGEEQADKFAAYEAELKRLGLGRD